MIIISETCYLVKIGDNTWAFVNIEEPIPYNKTIIMSGTADITGAQLIQLESTHIMNLNNYEQFLGANSASQDLITGAINIHVITSLFDDAIIYEEHSPINIITFLLDSVWLKFDNSNKLKPQAEFTMPWNLDENIVTYFLFLKNKQEK